MPCNIIVIACFIASMSAVVTAANFDDDFSAKCKGEFQKLKETKITVSPTQATSATEFPREVDATGYVLMLPESAVIYTAKEDGFTKMNEFSFWAVFKCKADKLVHESCRIGRSDEHKPLYLHPRRYLDSVLQVIGPKDGFAYICHADDGSLSPAAVGEVVKSTEAKPYSATQTGVDPEVGCFRISASQWCGFPPGVFEKGCLDGMDSLQKSKVNLNDRGLIVIDNEKAQKRMLLQVVCEQKKFAIQHCTPVRYGQRTEEQLATLKRGECSKEDKFAYACPKQNRGHSYQQLTAMSQSLMAPLTSDGKMPSALNCVKEIP